MKTAGLGTPEALAAGETRQLLSDLFHQLSQPLTTLCCSLELALLQSPTAEQYNQMASRALQQAEQVSWLSTAIRELFDAGQVAEGGELLELRQAVEAAIGDLLPVADSAGVQIGFLPPSPCPVWFDARRLRQGLFHLLGFGLGSSPAGAAMKIELEERGAEALLALTVSSPGGFRGEFDAGFDGGFESEFDAELDRRLTPGSNPDLLLPEKLGRRLSLGIARAVFEAAGGTLRLERGSEVLRIEVRFLRTGVQ
ncbi:MAG: hypothetical protein ACRD20_11720 [Terriglobales bacterium]